MSQIKNNPQQLNPTHRWIVPESAIGLRLDKFLGGLEGIQSRSRAIQLIQDQAVLVNGVTVKASYLLKGEEVVEVFLPEPESMKLEPLDLKLEILFEDQFLIVLNKPPGLVVHPAAGHAQDTLVNALIAHSTDYSMKFGEQRPGIVHRLDKDTSGIMVVAKTDQVHESLAQQFKLRTINRYYLAIALGFFKQPMGTITSFLARHPSDRKRYSSVRDRDKKIIREFHLNPGLGKWAHTEYQVLGTHAKGLSLVKLKLHTGRTHQIRVHLAELGHPILADEIYGSNRKESKIKLIPRLALHAAELGFIHPITQEEMNFRKEWPSDLRDFVHDHFPKGGVYW